VGVKELMFWFCGLPFLGNLVLGGERRVAFPRGLYAQGKEGRAPGRALAPLTLSHLVCCVEKHMVPLQSTKVRPYTGHTLSLSFCLILLDLVN